MKFELNSDSFVRFKHHSLLVFRAGKGRERSRLQPDVRVSTSSLGCRGEDLILILYVQKLLIFWQKSSLPLSQLNLPDMRVEVINIIIDFISDFIFSE